MQIKRHWLALIIAASIPSIVRAQPTIIPKSGDNTSAASANNPSSTTDDPTILKSALFYKLPTVDDFASTYPERAQALEKEGSVIFECTVSGEGLLTDCLIIKETPSGYEFGNAALEMSKFFKLQPLDKMGVAVQGRIFRTKITWTLRHSR